MKTRMFSRLVGTVLALAAVFTFVMPAAPIKAAGFDKDSIVGSWYGEYQEPYFYNKVYQYNYPAYMSITVDECDDDGNFTGEEYGVSKTTAGEKVGAWFKATIKGTFDYETGAFHMEQVKQISKGGSFGKITYENYDGTLVGDKIDGIVTNDNYNIPETLTFTFSKVSEWAKEEVTDANALTLLPETLKGLDLSQDISRAEFAAVAETLYENLTGEEAEEASVPFKDISGNVNESSIKKAYGLNIVVGISETAFNPDALISREDLVTMLCRVIKKYKYSDWTYSTDSQYSLDCSGVEAYADDGDISDYAKESVYFMKKMGIVNGINETTFAPKNTTDSQKAE